MSCKFVVLCYVQEGSYTKIYFEWLFWMHIINVCQINCNVYIFCFYQTGIPIPKFVNLLQFFFCTWNLVFNFSPNLKWIPNQKLIEKNQYYLNSAVNQHLFKMYFLKYTFLLNANKVEIDFVETAWRMHQAKNWEEI